MLVYCCLNGATGKVYVGKTAGSVERRWAKHLSSARNGSPILFHRAIRKYGPELFRVWVVDTARTEEELNRLEIQTIADMGALAPGGYNLRPGGEGGPHTQATREVLRALAIGRRHTEAHKAWLRKIFKGSGNPFYGKTHTDTTKQVLRDKCADVTRGVPKAEEHRRKIAEGLKGHTRTQEHASNLSQALTGRTLSEEHRKNLSASMKGVPKSEETKRKMREAAARRRGNTL